MSVIFPKNDNEEGLESVMITFVIKHFGVLLLSLIIGAVVIVLDDRHVTADEMTVQQNTLLNAIANISTKIDDTKKERKIQRVRDTIEDINSELETLQVYIDEAPQAVLTNARKQNVRRLENAKSVQKSELSILLSR